MSATEPEAARMSEFRGDHHVAKAVGAATEAQVKGDQSTSQKGGEGQVFGVVSLGPTQFVRDLPGISSQPGWRVRADWGFLETGKRFGSVVGTQFRTPDRLMQNGGCLRPHHRWRVQALASEDLESARSGATGQHDAGVKDQQFSVLAVNAESVAPSRVAARRTRSSSIEPASSRSLLRLLRRRDPTLRSRAGCQSFLPGGGLTGSSAGSSQGCGARVAPLQER